MPRSGYIPGIMKAKYAMGAGRGEGEGFYFKIYRLSALRANLLFQLLIVALSVSIFSSYSKIKQKRFADLIIFFWRIFKPFLGSRDDVRSHTKFWPDRFSRFDVYWIQTDRQTQISKEIISKRKRKCCVHIFLFLV